MGAYRDKLLGIGFVTGKDYTRTEIVDERGSKQVYHADGRVDAEIHVDTIYRGNRPERHPENTWTKQAEWKQDAK